VTIPLTCDSCQAIFRLNDSFAGKRCRCPKCQAILHVPLSPPASADHHKQGVKVSTQTSADPRQELLRQILAAFQAGLPPLRRTPAYRLGILLVAGAMLLLPVLYISLIVLCVFLVAWHGVHTPELLQGSTFLLGWIFLYFGPLLAGAILILFLLKPLFAPRPKWERGKALRFGKEPVLFAFVTRVARAVSAPEPARIEVDNQVNASASFGPGLAGLFGRELTLRIGLPLVAGLTVEQLAGVLAHELGHFSQGAGMRLTYLVRCVNAWFVRAVYHRDGLDESLQSWCVETGRFAPIFWLAALGVAITRGILYLFMSLGIAISSFLQRHMEYDADRFASRLVGSRVAQEVAQRIVFLQVASQGAHSFLSEALSTGKLVQDLSALIVAGADQIPAGLRRKLEREMSKVKAGLLDTHPCYQDRRARIRAENAPGIFHFDQPATVLFADYQRLAKRATADLYRESLADFGKLL
jgi:Zn-dependent protease with chaperone function